MGARPQIEPPSPRANTVEMLWTEALPFFHRPWLISLIMHTSISFLQTDQVSLPRPASDASMHSHAGDVPHILRRIPKDAEATSVLVGSVDFLDRPIMAFVRLSKGCYLGNLTEVPLPVRFLFVLMGPSDSIMNYHEIGRSISTLMTNTVRKVFKIDDVH